MAKLIDGKAVSASVRAQVAQEVQELKAKGLHPGLAVVIVGDDPASRTYVNNKKKACAETGIYSEEYALPATTTQEELLSLVRSLNEKPDIHGILVQSPLPKGLDEEAVIEEMNPQKALSFVKNELSGYWDKREMISQILSFLVDIQNIDNMPHWSESAQMAELLLAAVTHDGV